VSEIPAEARRDPSAAKNRALLLYVTRQEYIEIYYGATGRAVKDSALADAVTTAEARFHELLQTLNPAAGPVAVDSLGAEVRSLDRQYERVLARAQALGVALDRLELGAGVSRSNAQEGGDR